MDRKDPQVKKIITNLCNFYHEKTNLWVNIFDSEDGKLIEPYAKEFNETYYAIIPESLKEMFRITGGNRYLKKHSGHIYKIYLNYKVHNYTLESMRCEYCKKNIHSLNQILDMLVCNEYYHRLISKIYYPNAIEA